MLWPEYVKDILQEKLYLKQKNVLSDVQYKYNDNNTKKKNIHVTKVYKLEGIKF